jgi:hypothetical protein
MKKILSALWNLLTSIIYPKINIKNNKMTKSNNNSISNKNINAEGDIINDQSNITINNYEKTKDHEIPEVTISGVFDGNGHILHFQNIFIKNDSTKTIHYEYIMLFNNKIIELKTNISTKDKISLSAIDNLEYPTNKKNPYLLVYFYIRADSSTNNKIHYKLKQKLTFSPRVADNKLTPQLSQDDPIITKID